MNALVSAWYKKNPCLYALLPFALLYQSAVGIKRLSYRQGFKKSTRFPVPIAVIGNLTVGGTGKTPLIIALAQLLQERGLHPGIVSRGYGGRSISQPTLVTASSDPYAVGDEPVLIARRTGCPVVVHPNRVAAVKTLLAHYPCQVILSDDGLQHYALERDIEIAVVDGTRRFGNGLCLPAGPLREGVGRLKSVDFIVTQGQPRIKEYGLNLFPGTIYNLADPALSFDSSVTVHAVTGIGHPQRFFQQLRALGLSIIEHPFPDHHPFRAKDVDYGEHAAVIMTEKDAVKCQKFADSRHWCLPVDAECDSLFYQLFLEKLNFHRIPSDVV